MAFQKMRREGDKNAKNIRRGKKLIDKGEKLIGGVGGVALGVKGSVSSDKGKKLIKEGNALVDRGRESIGLRSTPSAHGDVSSASSGMSISIGSATSAARGAPLAYSTSTSPSLLPLSSTSPSSSSTSLSSTSPSVPSGASSALGGNSSTLSTRMEAGMFRDTVVDDDDANLDDDTNLVDDDTNLVGDDTNLADEFDWDKRRSPSLSEDEAEREEREVEVEQKPFGASARKYPSLTLGDSKVALVLSVLQKIPMNKWAITGSFALFLYTGGKSRQPPDIDILVEDEGTFFQVTRALSESKLFPEFDSESKNATIKGQGLAEGIKVDLAVHSAARGKITKGNLVYIMHPTFGKVPLMSLKQMEASKESILRNIDGGDEKAKSDLSLIKALQSS
jgi:hypothetical protein